MADAPLHTEAEAARPTIERLAARIADRMFASIWDRQARDMLERLLIEFAKEIQRSAIAP